MSVSLSFLYQFSILYPERGLENFRVCVCRSVFMCSQKKKKWKGEERGEGDSGQCEEVRAPRVPIYVR